MSHYGYRSSGSNVFVGIGERIDILQNERNVSAVDISKATGLDRRTVYVIKQNCECRLSSIVKLANYFNVSIDWLVYGKERTNV